MEKKNLNELGWGALLIANILIGIILSFINSAIVGAIPAEEDYYPEIIAWYYLCAACLIFVIWFTKLVVTEFIKTDGLEG
jgi:hypothetical protein